MPRFLQERLLASISTWRPREVFLRRLRTEVDMAEDGGFGAQERPLDLDPAAVASGRLERSAASYAKRAVLKLPASAHGLAPFLTEGDLAAIDEALAAAPHSSPHF